jgi:Tfp pilus assembly protein PilV
MVSKSRSQSGTLMVELVIAIAILGIAMLPLAYSVGQEHTLQRKSYQRAVAMELVDGEMEIMLAGQWRDFKEGTQPYSFHGESATNLPPGQAQLTIKGNHLRLDWTPDSNAAGAVHREADVK